MSTAIQKNNTAVATDKKTLTIKSLLEQASNQIKRALPRHMTAERMIRIAYSAIQRNHLLLECDPISLVKAVIEASELGLEPSGILGHAYLVPYYNGKTRRYEAQMQIGYRGFIELAGRSGRVKNITAEVVYDGDEFVVEHGLEPKLIHKPDINRTERSKPIACYAIARFTDGSVSYRVLTMADVWRHKQRSQGERAKENGKKIVTPWDTDEDEMIRKTAVRVLAKYLPLSPELTNAAVKDEYRDGGIEVDFSEVADDKTIEARDEPEALPAANTDKKPSQISTQEIIDRFKNAFGIVQSDLELYLGNPAEGVLVPADQWTDGQKQQLIDLGKEIKETPEYQRGEMLRKVFNLEPGSQG